MDVTLAKHEDILSEEKVKSAALGYVNKHWWPELRLDLDLRSVAADFYLFYAVSGGDDYLRARFEEYCQVVAQQFAIYMDAAIGGELRHAQFSGLGGLERSIARREWRIKRLNLGMTLLQNGRDMFYSYGYWGGGYGGPAWGKIADVLIDHLEGETSNFLFVDLALALQHNTGCMFDKVVNYWEQIHLQEVLDANLNENWAVLLKWASPWAAEMFLNWLDAEDSIVVENADISRPIRSGRGIVEGAIAVGSKVRISQTARYRARRGKECIVLALRKTVRSTHRGVEQSGHTLDAQIELDGKTSWIRIQNLELVGGSESGTRQYFS